MDIKNKLIYFLVLIILIICTVYGCERKNRETHEDLVIKQREFISTLHDSIKVIHNKNNTLTYQKTILSGDRDLLEKNKDSLNKSYLDLYNRYNKSKNTISVLNLTIKTLKDSIINNKPEDITDTSLVFEDSVKGLSYKIKVDNVKPLKNPTLDIQKLEVYNDLAIDYKFNKDGKIIVDVTPKDTATKVISEDGITSDKVTPQVVNPSFKDKLKASFTKPKIVSTLIKVGIGVLIGITLIAF